MIGWILLALVITFNALLVYRMIADQRRWNRERAEWHRRIADNWRLFTDAAAKAGIEPIEYRVITDDRSDTPAEP